MAVSQGFLDLVRELLAPIGHVTVRHMFGGASLYADGVLFALIADEVLYLKADEISKARFEIEGLKPFTYDGKTGPVAMSYWRAPERLYDDPDEMAEWAREALSVARKPKSKPAAPVRAAGKSAGTPPARAAKTATAPKRKR
jgi:DNA transformation protein and related proteins